MILHSIKRVLAALEDEEFPMDTHAIDYAVGDSEIEDGKGGLIPVRKLTERMGQRSFANPEEVIQALVEATHHKPVPTEKDVA